tara:strand:- start:685 stop:1659 length:975 start_codon:yes stop_codon:yes gene_type:complete
MKFLLSLMVVLMSSSIYAASSHVGMIVKKQGKVELLTNPSKTASGAGYVLFEGTYYKQAKVRLGKKLTNGSILRTGKGAKVKIVYKNGDQMNIGEGTAYQVSWAKKKVKGKNPGAINLMYGSIRGVINKKGPRSGIKIKTKSAVMGIRGTDFHIGQRGTSGRSSLSVLRGKVEIADKRNPKKKMEVAQGFSAEIKKEVKNNKGKKKKTASLFQVAKTTKNELVDIQKESEIKQSKKELAGASKAVKKQLARLEKKAIANTLSDIKEYDPALYKTLKDKNVDDVDKINKVVVGKVFEKAPVKKVKIGIDDDELEENAYDKYFKID